MTCNVRAEMRVGSIPTLDSVSKRYETLDFNDWSRGCDLGQTLDTNSCHVGTSDGCKGRNKYLGGFTHLGVPASSRSSYYSPLSVAAMTELRKTALLVQLLFGLKEISAIGEQICAFLGNDDATCIQLSNFEGVWLNGSTSGSVESRYKCPTLVTVSEIFARVWKTSGLVIVSECGWFIAHVDLHWG